MGRWIMKAHKSITIPTTTKTISPRETIAKPTSAE